MEFKDLLTEKQLCQALDLPDPKVEKSRVISDWIKRGLPYMEVTDKRFFWSEEVAAFLKRQRPDEVI